GDVAPIVARERARIDVVAAAGRRPDQEIDVLAGVVIAGRGGGRERGERDQSSKDACLKAHRKSWLMVAVVAKARSSARRRQLVRAIGSVSPYAHGRALYGLVQLREAAQELERSLARAGGWSQLDPLEHHGSGGNDRRDVAEA